MRVRLLLTCVPLLLGGCLLGDADGEAPPPASSGLPSGMIIFNPAVEADVTDRSDGPLLLPRTLNQPAEEELPSDFVFDEDAFVSSDLPIPAGTIDGTLGEGTFSGATDFNFGWYTSWMMEDRVESYLTLEVASEGASTAGMLIVSLEGNLEPVLEAVQGGSTAAQRVPVSINAWVVACYGPEMYEWDSDVPASASEVTFNVDPQDPGGVVFNVEATFNDGAPVRGTILAARDDLENLLALEP